MSELRPAPYPADTRAKGWRFELDYEQIEQSDTWGVTKPEARPWLLMLWMTAWKQVPCGSLPADDEVIAGKLGIPDELWAKHKGALLRGWWLADDGRLYQDTLVARVGEMMRKRRSDSDRQAAKRLREAAESSPTHADVTRDTGATHADVGCESSTDNRPPTKEEVSNPSGSHPPAKAAGTKTPSVPCPFDALVDAYHEALPALPRVRLRDGPTWDDRKKAMRKVWSWVLSSRKSDGTARANNGDEALEWFRGYFARVNDNDWLMGRTAKPEHHQNWKCDFDFLLSKNGMKAVIEKTAEAA